MLALGWSLGDICCIQACYVVVDVWCRDGFGCYPSLMISIGAIEQLLLDSGRSGDDVLKLVGDALAGEDGGNCCRSIVSVVLEGEVAVAQQLASSMESNPVDRYLLILHLRGSSSTICSRSSAVSKTARRAASVVMRRVTRRVPGGTSVARVLYPVLVARHTGYIAILGAYLGSCARILCGRLAFWHSVCVSSWG